MVVSRSQITGEANCTGNIDPRRPAHTQTLMLQKVVDDGQGFIVRYLVGVVDGRALEIGRDSALPDPFGDRGAFGVRHAGLDQAVYGGAHGSAAAIRTYGLRALSAVATPASVPPVPTAQVKPSTCPAVCRQISGPVVSIWARRLAILSN